MKTMKKVFAVMLSVITVCSAVTISNTVDTKAAVKIKFGKKITVTVGSSDIIVVKGKATAKSSNKKVATVKVKKGKTSTITVKGFKSGKAKVTVKVKKSKKKVPVTVNPKKVASVKATLVGNNSANISWSAAKGAVKYQVYHSTNASTGFKLVATVKGTSYKNDGLSLGKQYYYKVKSIGNKSTKGAFSPVASVKTWKLVWNDEFNGTSLDTSKWNNNGATGAGGYGNSELQNYQMQYCEVKNGSLIIKPQFKWDKSKNVCVNNSYYSTKLWTRNQHKFKYGKIEFVAKMPHGQGTWAAGWMLGENNSWPLCGEIDVFETTSELAKTKIPQSIHCNKFNGMKTSSGNKHYDSTITTATTAYHTYAIEWTAKKIDFYIDGKKTGTYDPSMYSLEGDGTDNIDIWPYNQPFYLIVNCAIGGTLGGKVITPKYWTKIATNGNIETYEDYLYFDAVRVYQ